MCQESPNYFHYWFRVGPNWISSFLKGKSGEKRGPSVSEEEEKTFIFLSFFVLIKTWNYSNVIFVLILSFDPLPSLPFFSSFCFLSWKKNLFEKSLALHLQERNVHWRDKNWLIQITIIIIFYYGECSNPLVSISDIFYIRCHFVWTGHLIFKIEEFQINF